MVRDKILYHDMSHFITINNNIYHYILDIFAWSKILMYYEIS